MSHLLVRKRFPLQRPKPRKKDPEAELRKELRRQEEYQKLVKQLGETEITGRATL